MIVSDSEKTESSRHSARSPGSEAARVMDAPPSPPPYTPSASGSNVHPQGQGRPSSSGGFRVPSGSMPNPNASPAPRANLPPRCNHLVERKSNSGISGTWHVDTTLQIPEGLLPPITEVDGQWNQDIQNARKEREREKRRRESIWRSTPTTPLPPPPVEIRPNLMLATTNAPIRGQVHVVSTDGSIRPAIIVSQCSNASINLTVHAAPDQPLRVFANSSNASVNVRIPPSFEGAVIMSTTHGSVKISDPIKEKLTTFSSTSNTTRCFIGDWQAHGFGMPHPDDDPPLPDFQSTPADPFAKWTGPLVHLSSSNASLSLSFNDESTWSSGPTTGFWGFVSGLFGGDDSSSSSQPPQPSQQSRSPQPSRPSAPNDGQPQDKKLPPPPPSNSPPQDKKLPLPPDDLIALD